MEYTILTGKTSGRHIPGHSPIRFVDQLKELTGLTVTEMLEIGVTPTYSPDVAPSDFHLFPELKKNLGGTQFQDDDELEEAGLGFQRGQAAEFFDSGFHKWVSRMQKCVERNGEYVEK
ncbi:hypothetical protein LAZ67_21000719 [Cordylochernes scorpioides]|uniref:Uncharacterized protein n=1 Tax=Cordylochernes scorpioides TaxID=51811 RepID=A0ABY6LLL6_9ARAC|nr:hypothetical protein LAZ67_21000719 [Cordylochernes scorpioides]